MASLHVFSSYHIHYKIPQLEIGGCYQNSIRCLEFLLYFLQFPNSLRLTKGWLFWHTAGALLILILLFTVAFLARILPWCLQKLTSRKYKVQREEAHIIINTSSKICSIHISSDTCVCFKETWEFFAMFWNEEQICGTTGLRITLC